jgi:phosphoesterase RecJ-like protein
MSDVVTSQTCQESAAGSPESRIWEVLTDGTPVVVTSHVRLDGDAIGAALALWHGLRSEGVSAHLRLEPPLPSVFDFLPGLGERIRSFDTLPARFHLVVVDCGSLTRIGQLAEYADRAVDIINIDHHRTREDFGDHHLVCEKVSSSGELVYGVLQTAGVEITREIALAIYVAILTDTGGFSYGNTTKSAFEICARLVDAGASPWRIAERIFYSPPASVVRLKGLAIGTLRLEDDGRIATCQITRETFDQTGTRPVDTQGFADIPISVEGVEATALLKELSPEHDPYYVKVSLRSRASVDSVDVSDVAESFGGGGHRHAAGCELEGPLETARQRVVQTLRRRLEAAGE